MSFRDSDTTAGQFTSAVSLAGVFVRYAFYFFGMIVFGLIAFGVIWLWGNRVQVVQDKPAFRITDGSFTRLPVSSDIIISGLLGRVEVMQYGTLDHRGIDLTVAIAFPPPGGLQTRPTFEPRETKLLRNMRFQTLSTHFDLETRYGPVHAVETRVETDGRWKQCLAFSSRFDTRAVFLSGWTCDATGTKPGADALACALDKLVIDKELPTKEADAYLRARMTRPAYCAARQVTQTFDTGSRPIAPPSRWSQPSARTRL
ncbi:hypothetical protein [Tardiphaga sp. OK245]|uniref:hypothetical protein n=1 Tax=Tardiphaga sp. OK245 TaxID=1855306 RepID=UPI0008A765B9|nr:hypothetical protein [Tardiphaga sp. OK245]SEI22128.1 hypothetical protein SAMN05216367_5451 [Tardiphaga sp. OK245]